MFCAILEIIGLFSSVQCVGDRLRRCKVATRCGSHVFVCVSDKHPPVIFVVKLVLSTGREIIPAYLCDGFDMYSAIKC